MPPALPMARTHPPAAALLSFFPTTPAAAQVLRPFMLRRMKEGVAGELPQKSEHLLSGEGGPRGAGAQGRRRVGAGMPTAAAPIAAHQADLFRPCPPVPPAPHPRACPLQCRPAPTSRRCSS